MRNSLISLLLAGFTAASAGAAQSETLTPYRCAPTSETTLSEKWSSSDARAKMVETNGNVVRKEHGQIYLSFMDDFWADIQETGNPDSIVTAGNLLNIIGLSFLKAHSKHQTNLDRYRTTPQLVFTRNDEKLTFTAEEITKTALYDRDKMAALLVSNVIGEDYGFDIKIVFNIEESPNSIAADYEVTIGEGLGTNTTVEMGTDVFQILGFSTADTYKAKNEGAEIKKDVICPLAFG